MEVELPGMDKNDIHVDLKDGYLNISVNKTEKNESGKKENYIHRERSFSCSRSYYVGDFRKEDIKAKYENGILNVTIPKEAAKKAEESGFSSNNFPLASRKTERGGVSRPAPFVFCQAYRLLARALQFSGRSDIEPVFAKRNFSKLISVIKHRSFKHRSFKHRSAFAGRTFFHRTSPVFREFKHFLQAVTQAFFQRFFSGLRTAVGVRSWRMS